MGDNRSNIILSICLATYNQPDKVKIFFDNIIFQLNSEISSRIEIVVRDDSANTETENLINDYYKKISVPIRYFKGKKEGLDATVIFLTKEARGKYVWWFGDDILTDGAIKKILNIIESNSKVSLIYVNSRNIDDDKDVAFNKDEDCFFNNRNQVLKEINDQLGFITATIFRKSDAIRELEAAYKYTGTSWVNLFIILSVLARGEKFYFVKNPYILSFPKLPGEARWYDSFQVHGINYFLIVQEFKDKFDKKIIRKALADKFSRAWRAVIVERARGFTTGFGSRTPKIKQMFKCYWNFPEFYIALPLFLMPRSALRYLYKIYKFFQNTRKIIR
ncbi:MAG: glycosyltransferase family 2 protein [Patescibacteria group bacterium]